jgi:intraflagellar transport protein 74
MRSTSGMSVLSHGTRSRIAASNAMSVKSSIVMPIVAAGQEVSVLPRPLTAAGGISLSNKKSNAILSFNDEKISNSQYFAAFISKKEKEIVDEIQRLKNDTKIIEANILANSAKQKTYNTLLSDVKKLQETIADYNLAMENETNGCDLEELEDQVIKLKERNQGLVNEIDNVFIRAKRLEEEAKRIEEEKVIINKKIQLVLDSSDRESNIKYRRLNAQLEEVHQFKNYLHSEIKTLQESLKDMQTKLEQRNNKDLLDRIDKLEEEIASRMRDLETINEKLFVAQMSPEEAKSYLLEKVKGNKANEVKIDEEIATVQDKLQRLEAEESRLMKTICDAEPPEISNCKAIWEQKKSADDFLAASNNTVNTLKAENENMAKNIATLREVLKEKTIDHADNNKMNAKSLHDTINYKSKNLNNSKWTISQLLDQKLTRTEEVSEI